LEFFLLVFSTLFIAEMADKSQLVTFCLSVSNSGLKVFLGAFIALSLNIGLVVIFGSIIVNLIPQNIIILIGAAIFLGIGFYTFFSDQESKPVTCPGSGFWTAFTLIFIAEMGDKTQLAVLSLIAVSSDPLVVLAGSLSAMALNHALAAFLGSRYISKIPRKKLNFIVAFLFVFLGIMIIFAEFV